MKRKEINHQSKYTLFQSSTRRLKGKHQSDQADNQV